MRIIEREGFEWVKTKGSHRFYCTQFSKTLNGLSKSFTVNYENKDIKR